jgi:hypothetical protein
MHTGNTGTWYAGRRLPCERRGDIGPRLPSAFGGKFCTRYLLSLPQVDLSATDKMGCSVEHAARMYMRFATADAVRAVRAGALATVVTEVTYAAWPRHVWLALAAAYEQAVNGLS